MKKLVVYDSYFGNTEKIAQSVAKSISAQIIKVQEIDISDLDNVNMLVVGSPTHGGRATEEIQKFLNDIPEGLLKNTKIAVFDTRILGRELNFFLGLLVKTIGYAAPKMVSKLISKGGELIVPAEGFVVTGKEGPLTAGEIERAEEWIQDYKSIV